MNGVMDKVVNGDVSQRRFFDQEGRVNIDLDTNDHGKPRGHPYGKRGEHAHDYTWQDGKVIDRTLRDLTDQERSDNEDIL